MFVYIHTHRAKPSNKAWSVHDFFRRKFALQTVFILSMTAIRFLLLNSLSLLKWIPYNPHPSFCSICSPEAPRSTYEECGRSYNSCHCLLFNKAQIGSLFFWLGTSSPSLREILFYGLLFCLFSGKHVLHWTQPQVKTLLNISYLDPTCNLTLR